MSRAHRAQPDTRRDRLTRPGPVLVRFLSDLQLGDTPDAVYRANRAAARRIREEDKRAVRYGYWRRMPHDRKPRRGRKAA